MGFTDVITMLLSGGATGLIGTALSFGAKFLEQKQADGQALAMRKLDLDEMDREAKYASQRHSDQMESAEMAGEYTALAKSYAEAAKSWTQGMNLTAGQQWMIVLVDVVRGLIRPFLTIGLVCMVGYSFYDSPHDADIRLLIVHATIYMATTAVLWWFGSRRVEAALKSGRTNAK